MGRTLSRRRQLLAVACGGFLGTLTRYLLSMFIQGLLGKIWPYDILFINITGAFALALVSTLADATFLVGPTRRLFINVGFMGAYTTFSSMALGDILLLTHGYWLPALLYILLSLAGGILAVITGEILGQKLVKQRKTPQRQHQTKTHQFANTTEQADNIAHTGDHLDLQDDLLIPDQYGR